jgi:flagellar basal body-associated protein FliL
MSNKNLMLLVAAAAAYYFFFMKKKPAQLVTSPGVPDQPAPAQPVAMLQPAIQTESVSIVDEIRTFSEGNPQPQHSENIYQNYYVNQVSGVKKMGVPFTI